MDNVTATEKVKTFGSAGLRYLDLSDLRAFFDAKGFTMQSVAYLVKTQKFAPICGDLLFRNRLFDEYLLDQYGESLPYIEGSKLQTYNGSHLQNERIDRATSNSGLTGQGKFGQSAATDFHSSALVPGNIANVPIAILGYGPGGIFAHYALRQLGFSKITVYEKSNGLGIWNFPNVYMLSRNNPNNISFYKRGLAAAPGEGNEVRTFLAQLSSAEEVRNEHVLGVEPGQLRHRVKVASGNTSEYPIVINTIGIGKPRPVSDRSRIMTNASERHAGIRWQIVLDKTKSRNKRFILIGLGNSTAEMLYQLHKMHDDGVAVDYRILTHYPKEAVYNPSSYVHCNGKMYRVFRDISIPNLVDYQGDLPHSRHDYYRALHGGKIISDVKTWKVDDVGIMNTFDGHSQLIESIAYDQVMTLIGYSQPKQTMLNFGCSYDDENGCALFDYDGESVASKNNTNPSKRLHKGYFGFGSVLESPVNPNAIVIPGMMHRIGDLLFGIVMRAIEYKINL